MLFLPLFFKITFSFNFLGGFHSFALSMSGSVFGWGKNNYGQLGVSDTLDKCQPTQLSTMRTLGVKYITAGVDHSAFLTQVIYCRIILSVKLSIWFSIVNLHDSFKRMEVSLHVEMGFTDN